MKSLIQKKILILYFFEMQSMKELINKKCLNFSIKKIKNQMMKTNSGYFF